MASKPGIPEGYHTITPAIAIRNAAKAIEFYKQAFGAEETMRLNAPDGRVAHAEIKIGDSRLMISDDFEMSPCKSPQSLGGTTATLHIYVPDADAAFDRAVRAGATARMPVSDMFWGDRYGQVMDPFGHIWSVGTQKEKLSPQEIGERAKEFFAKMHAA
jgi:PhnB protein